MANRWLENSDLQGDVTPGSPTTPAASSTPTPWSEGSNSRLNFHDGNENDFLLGYGFLLLHTLPVFFNLMRF